MKRNRYYSLFERQGKRWVRLTEMAFELDVARRVFQDALLYSRWHDPISGGFRQTAELRLRPVEAK